jgi:tRNA1(Val) A37 N6-methylase TrmN6
LPVHPKPATPAIRVILRAGKGASGPLVTLPGLVLAAADGTSSAKAEAVLRHASALSLGDD